ILFYTFYGQPDPAGALAHFIKSYHPDATDLSPAEARRVLAGKRALVILDGAEDAANLPAVRDVLPPTCAVLVTTRVPGGLALAGLPRREAVALLQTLAGEMDPATADRICALLDDLPLAVTLAGQYIAQSGDPADYLAWLEAAPLEAVDNPENLPDPHRRDSIPVLVEKSLARAGDQARAVLAVTGLLSLAPFDREVIAAALPNADPRRPLDRLVRYGLLRRAETGYAPAHALVHRFARRRLAPPAGALPRLAGYYTALAETESEKGLPGYRVLDGHRGHILAVLEACAAAGEWPRANKLVWAVKDYLDVQGYTADRVQVLETGVRAARALGQRYDEGAHLGHLGLAYRDLGQVEKAIEYHTQALAISREIGDRRGEGADLGHLGLAYHALGQVEK
ncbi:MAG: tetratricopeptide repeat-containing protein, partial [Calditrichaeota bacterium]